jgi:hypothetical protein
MPPAASWRIAEAAIANVEPAIETARLNCYVRGASLLVGRQP